MTLQDLADTLGINGQQLRDCERMTREYVAGSFEATEFFSRCEASREAHSAAMLRIRDAILNAAASAAPLPPASPSVPMARGEAHARAVTEARLYQQGGRPVDGSASAGRSAAALITCLPPLDTEEGLALVEVAAREGKIFSGEVVLWLVSAIRKARV